MNFAEMRGQMGYQLDTIEEYEDELMMLQTDLQEIDRDSDWAFELFNDWLDEEDEYVYIRGREYKPSELLQGLPYEYRTFYESWKRQMIDQLQEDIHRAKVRLLEAREGYIV